MPSIADLGRTVAPSNTPPVSHDGDDTAQNADTVGFGDQLEQEIENQDVIQELPEDVAEPESEEQIVSPEQPLIIEDLAIQEENVIPDTGNELPPEEQTDEITAGLTVAGTLQQVSTAQTPSGTSTTPVTQTLQPGTAQQNPLQADLSTSSDSSSADKPELLLSDADTDTGTDTADVDFKQMHSAEQVKLARVETSNPGMMQRNIVTTSDTSGATVMNGSVNGPIHSDDTLEHLPELSRQHINSPVNSRQFGQEMAQKLTMLIQGNQRVAELQLNPARLGPMDVSISVDDDKAMVHFVTSHQSVKEAVELAMPRLREMLEQQGLNLSQFDVSSRHSENNDSGSDRNNSSFINETEQQAAEEIQIHSEFGNDAALSIYI